MIVGTCGVRLAVVLTTVLHFDRRQAEGLDHLVGALTPVGGAKSQDGEGQSQSGQGQGEQGARATGHTLQHGNTGEKRGRVEDSERERWGEGEAKRRRKGDAARGNKISEIVGMTTDGAKRVEQMLRGGFKR